VDGGIVTALRSVGGHENRLRLPGSGKVGTPPSYSREVMMKHTRSKSSRGLVTRPVVYRDQRYPPGSLLEIKVDVRRDDVVAVRTGTPLHDVQIIEVRDT
jgi:hypothetical protein